MIQLILKNGDAVDKALFIYVIYIAKQFTKRFDVLTDTVSKLNLSLEKLIVKHDNQEERVKDLEDQMEKTRERWHDVTAPRLSQIELNSENIKEIKERLNGS